MNKLILVFIIFISVSKQVQSQYAPPAGQVGTTAVHKDSGAIVSWANGVVDFKRGAADIANGWTVLASFGDSTEALGYAQGDVTSIVSLGDSGYITLSFPYPIKNGPGNDFAVFENSFSDDYLEFAHVEVSSDGIYFVRLPSISVIPVITQTATYANSITEYVHNLAGKYRQGYGTPFDLEDIIDSTGINLDSVLYVRVVDVIGSIDPAFGSFDSQGNIINDPYPTDFANGGFDLDGVAVINENNIYASVVESKIAALRIYPNPSNGIFYLQSDSDNFSIQIFDTSGKLVWQQESITSHTVEIAPELISGLYFVNVLSEFQVQQQTLIIQ